MITSNDSKKAIIYGIEKNLASALSDTLTECGCTVQGVSGRARMDQADIVFCADRLEVLGEVLSRSGKTPVVVVSRLPEVEQWLDSLEAGAADYCAAPFESTHLRWLLDTHTRARKALAAA